MGRMRNFLGFLSVLFVSLFVSGAHAAGTQRIGSNGALSTDWTVTGAKELMAQYTCNDHYNDDDNNGTCEANIYTITLDSNGGGDVISNTGTTISSIYEKYGVAFYSNANLLANSTIGFNGCTQTNQSCNALPAPERTGYTFNGWYTAKSGGTQIINASGYAASGSSGLVALAKKFTADGTLYAQWTANKITLNWQNGGRGTVPTNAATECTYGSTFAIPAAMTATGYTFGGWKTEANKTLDPARLSAPCTKEYLGKTSGTATITGQWTENDYELSLDDNGDFGGMGKIYFVYNKGYYLDSSHSQQIQKVDCNSNSLTNPCTGHKVTQPTRTGYTFGGYKLSTTGAIIITEDGQLSSSANNTYDVDAFGTVLEAVWTPNEYTITLNDNGATTKSVPSTLYTKYDNGVYLDADFNKQMTEQANKITTPVRKYTVTLHGNGGFVGGETQHLLTISYSYLGHFNNATDGLLQYINKSGAVTESGSSAKQNTSNTTWYAKWNRDDVSVPETIKIGNRLTGWNTKQDGTGARVDLATYVPTTTQPTIYAQWEEKTKVELNLDVNGGTCTNCTTTIYQVYDTGFFFDSDMTTKLGDTTCNNNSLTNPCNLVKLPTRVGYKFGGYYAYSTLAGEDIQIIDEFGYLNGSVSDSMDIKDNKLTARWIGNPYTVTFKSGNTTLGTQNFTYGTTQNLTSVTNLSGIPVSSTNGWTFAGWSKSVDTTTVTYNNAHGVSNLTTTSGGNVTLYGIWKRDVEFKYYNSETATSTTTNTRTQYYYNTSTTAAAPNAVSTYALATHKTYKWAPVGWVLNSTSGNTTASTATTTTANITPAIGAAAKYYALYKRTATLAYAGGDGASGSTTSTTGTQYFNAGSTSALALSLTVASNGFTRTGYTFARWYSTGTNYHAAGTKFPFSNTGWTSSDTITLTATWNANCNKITLNQNGGTGGTTELYKKSGSTEWFTDSNCSTANKVTTLPKSPTKTNATFNGYFE